MAALEQAAKRMEAALTRLERAVENGLESGGGDNELQRALDAARKENAALQQLAGSAAKRLDSTIGRLKSSLEA